MKRSYLFVGILVLVIGAVAVTFILARPAMANMTPQYWAKAKATRASVACLSADPKLVVPKDVRSHIEMTTLTYLIDVPAGTNVDVMLATYSPTKVTGSDRYPAKYGNYNFTMIKQRDGWHFTTFEHCS